MFLLVVITSSTILRFLLLTIINNNRLAYYRTRCIYGLLISIMILRNYSSTGQSCIVVVRSVDDDHFASFLCVYAMKLCAW